MTAAKRINLALQGGGAHGAFTWGVLDRLLEDRRLDFEGISGTSAGALNGALLAYGMATGGREAARELLDRLWHRLAGSNVLSPLQPTWMDRWTGNRHLEGSPFYAGLDLMVRVMSPYQFNPLGLNPLRHALTGLVDFDVLRGLAAPRLYVSATNVTRGKLKVFSGDELSPECLVASTCLPFLFQAEEIGGEHYWDGGYMGNPTLYPLIHECRSADILVVQVTPLARPEVPTQTTAIVDRVNEISFNSTFLRELRAMELINRLIRGHKLSEAEAGVRAINLHMVAAAEEMAALGVSTKMNNDLAFLLELRGMGREAASAWLETSFDRVGVESTAELGNAFV
ncbi:MAG TPA: patatin-like phospholipase family protein [Azospirillaceae bacterium]|nr:patatin-like phospholipase family protein [Azospirillaceae bacterium]